MKEYYLPPVKDMSRTTRNQRKRIMKKLNGGSKIRQSRIKRAADRHGFFNKTGKMEALRMPTRKEMDDMGAHAWEKFKQNTAKANRIFQEGRSQAPELSNAALKVSDES